jgi:hypothetical protein
MFVMSNKVYEFLKKVTTIFLPAFSTLYIALAELWDLPASLQVAGTCAALATFLGVCLGISSSTYRKLDTAYDGNVVVNENPDGGILYSLEPDVPLDSIQDMPELRLKVVPGQPPQHEQG